MRGGGRGAYPVDRAAAAGEIAVRAEPKVRQGRRAIYDDPKKGPAGLKVVPRQWAAFGWDGVDPEGTGADPLNDAEAGVRLVLRRLPHAFRDVSCLWQVSASAGFKPGFRMRTWHLLDHPTCGAELKVWLAPAIKRGLVDPVTLVECQPHYLGVRVVGGPDPCPRRFGVLRLARDQVKVPDIEAIRRQQQAREQENRQQRRRSLADFHDRHREDHGLREQNITSHDLRGCVRHLAASEEAHPNVNGAMSDRAIAAALDAVEHREILKVLKLFRQIRRELGQPRRGLNSVWFDPEARVKVGGEIERLPRVFAGYVREPKLARTTPVRALDGTGALELNRKVFGESMEGHAFKAPRDAKVIQTVDKLFSRQSLTGCDRHGNPVHGKSIAEAGRLRGHVVELLRLLPGQVLLVTYKAAEELIIDDLPEHVHVAHFGNVRGLNAYEHCETVVILGREQPSAPAIEAQARPFTATDAEPFMPFGEYVAQSRGRRQRQDGTNVAVVPVHPDPRRQAMLEQVREAEIAQAVDRVRPVFNRRRVILLTDVPVDITVDSAVPWRELRPNALLLALTRHGVLPSAPSDMHKGSLISGATGWQLKRPCRERVSNQTFPK